MKTIKFLLLIILLFPHSAFAHRVGLFCYLEENTLYGEGYFGGGGSVKNAKVEIYDLKNNNLVAETVTDDEGRFSLLLENIEDIKVVLTAGMGHRAEYILKTEIEEEKAKPYSGIKFYSIMIGIGAIIGVFYLLYILRRKNAS
ncbi:MAG: carboxypeptidase regulatory-like domain-containing protein [Candidatus Saelkia tenebricola]|nr:carboxypeptidase regulatory-like domain-containing protein [Candidatus Saelkia tenebricola]